MTSTRKAIFVIIAAGALLTAAHALPATSWTVSLVEWVRARGPSGALAFGLVYVAGTVLLVPGTGLTMAGGFLYGSVWGVVIVSPASVLGATAAFLLARSRLRGFVSRRLRKHPRFESVEAAVERRSFQVVLLFRLAPVFVPFAALNYLLGLTRVRLRDYVVASWIGMLPATIFYVWIGSALHEAAELVSGRLPDAFGWGNRLFWAGFLARLMLALLAAAIVREAVARRADGACGGQEGNRPDPDDSRHSRPVGGACCQR